MNPYLKRVAGWLPLETHGAMRRFHCRRSLKRGRFISNEYEYHILDRLVRLDDWVLDIGANFGVYTARMSSLVGPKGRVIAVEPVMQSFDVLNAVVQQLPLKNVTLLNVACFDKTCALPLRIPTEASGIENLYESALDPGADGPIALCLSVDSLDLPEPISLVKIDTEGAELSVLKGMSRLLERDHPILIVEWIHGMETIVEYLAGFGYRVASAARRATAADRFVYQNHVFQSVRSRRQISLGA